MKKALRALFKTLSIITTVLVAVSIISFVILPLFGIKPYVVLSGSMEPAIKTGSVAWVNTNDRDVEVGDVVTFKLDNDTLVTHRIVNVEDDVYTTKGDNNENEDFNPVYSNQICGTYILSVPEAGYIIQVFQEKRIIGFYCMIFLLSIICMDILLSDSNKNNGGLQNNEN